MANRESGIKVAPGNAGMISPRLKPGAVYLTWEQGFSPAIKQGNKYPNKVTDATNKSSAPAETNSPFRGLGVKSGKTRQNEKRNTK